MPEYNSENFQVVFLKLFELVFLLEVFTVIVTSPSCFAVTTPFSNTLYLTVSLVTGALMEEGIIGSDIYELLMMTYRDLNDIDVSFNFEVNEEEVVVNGYNNQNEEFSVGSIIINEVEM